MPKGVAQAIYSQIEGAKLSNVTGLGSIWTMDCDKEVNIEYASISAMRQ